MAKYIFDNEPFSEEELLEIAKERSVTLQELLEKNPEIKLSDDETEVTEEVITDPTKEGKEKPTTGEDATVVEETVAPDTASALGDTSLVLQEIDNSPDAIIKRRKINKLEESSLKTVKLNEIILRPKNEVKETTNPVAEGMLDSMKAVTKETSKNKIAEEYFNLPKDWNGNGFYGPSIDRPTFYPNLPGGRKSGRLKYKNDYDTDLKNYYGEKKYKIWKSLTSNIEGQITPESINKAIDINSIPSDVVQNVVKKEQYSAGESYINEKDLNEAQQDKLRVYLPGDEQFKDDVANATLQRKKDQLDFQANFGRPLLRTETIKGRTYTYGIDKAMSEAIKSQNKRIETNFKNLSLETEDLFEKEIKNYTKTLLNLDKSLNDRQIAVSNLNPTNEEELNIANNKIIELNLDVEKRNLFVSENIKNINNQHLILKKKSARILSSMKDAGLTQLANKAITKSYALDNQFSLVLEEAFLGSGAMLMASTLKGVGDTIQFIDNAMFQREGAKPFISENEINLLKNLKGAAVDYNQEIKKRKETELPETLGENDKGYYGRMLVDNSPSILTALSTMGASGLGAAALRKASNAAMGVFFTMEAGGQISALEIQQRNAPKIIKALENQLKLAEGSYDKNRIKEEILEQKNVLNAAQWEKSLNSTLYGGIATFAERFGTLGYIKNFQKYSKAIGYNEFRKIANIGTSRALSKTLGSLGGIGIGIAIEETEEIFTKIGQNLTDQIVLNVDKNTFEGIDKEFFRNVAVSSFAISGPSASQNIYSAVAQEFSDRKEIKKESELREEILNIQSQLNKGGLTRDGRKLLEKSKKKILKELALDNTKKVLKISNLTAEEFELITETNRELRNITKEAGAIAQSGDTSNWSEKELKRLKKEYEGLLSTRAKVFDKKRTEVLDLFKNQTTNVVDAVYNYELKNFNENLIKNQKNVNYNKFNDINTLKKYLKNNNYSKEFTKEALEGYNQGAYGFNPEGSNDIFIFEENIIFGISAGGIDAKLAAMTPLHEFGHIQTYAAGIIKDSEVADSADLMIKSIQQKVTDLFNERSITAQQYAEFKARIQQYTNSDGKVNANELIQAVADFTNMGAFPRSAFNSVFEIKTYINNVMKHLNGDASMYFDLNTSNDVFNFVSSIYKKATAGIQLPESEEEKTENILQSEKAFKEAETESIKQTLDKIDQINLDTKDNENKFKSKEEFRNSPQFGEVLQEMLAEDGLFDGLIIDKSGIDFTARNPQETTDFIENVKGDLIKRFSGKNNLGNFDPTKNSLFGYFTGNNGLIVNAIKNVKKDFVERDIKTSSLDVEAGETGSIREIGVADEIDMDAFMAQTDATNESNITNLKLIKEEIKTSDGKKITKLKENIEREVREKGPKLTEKELTYKTSPDYGTPTILKAINDSFQNSTEFKKLYDAKSKQLDREIADGKTNREGQKISKANELQKFKTGYILRPEDFAGSGNLSQKKFPIVKDFIDQNIKLIIENLPKAAVTRKDPVSKKIENTSTGVPSNFLNNPNLYTKTEERIGNSGIFVYKKRKGITSKDIFEMLEGKPLVKGKFGLPMQNAKQFINNLGQFATNQELRLQDFITPQQSADLEGGKDSKILYSLNTKGDGKWIQNPLNPLDNKEKIYSFKVGDTDYNIKTSGHKVGSLDVNAYGFEIFDGNKFEEEFINGIANDDKSLGLLFADKDNNATQITGAALKGLTNQFKVFGIVANSTINLIKKEKLNSITFNGREESRQKLYEAMVQKFKKELGWESYNYELEEGSGEAYIVYDPKVFTNPETAATTEKESRILFSKPMPLLQKNNILESIEKFQKNKSYANLNDDVFNGIKGVIENSETYKQVFDGIKKLTFKTLGLNSQRKFERELLISLIGLADSKTKDSFIPAFETYRKLFKYEQQVVGYNFAVNYLNLKFKNAKGKEAKQEAITNFLKYISRSIKTLKINGITTNKAVFDKIIKPLVKENNLGFDVLTENKLTYITLDGEKLKGLKDINEIKKDFNGSIAKIKDESEAVLKYYIEIINEAKENDTVEQIKGLIALTAADQRGMLRKLSTPGFEIVAPGKKMILEHETTALELFNKLIDYAKSIDNVGLDALKKFVSQAKVNLIPETLDKILNVKGYIGNGKARYKAAGFVKALQKYKDAGKFFNYAKESKNLLNLSKSKFKAAKNNNSKLPKSEQFPKSWWLSEAVTGDASQMVLDRLKEVDDRNNEARINFSKAQSLDETFNNIIEAKTGIETYKRFDRVEGAVKGSSKGKTNFFIPPSAEDFVGLLYKTLGKGKVGDRQMQFYKDNLLDPYGRAMNDVSSARVAMFEDYKTLKENLNIIPKDLSKKGFEEYTREQAVRIYIWDQQGNKIPGMFKTNQQKLVDYVIANPDLKEFGDQLIAMQKGDGYVTPKEGWLAGTITTDLLDSVNSIKRKKYLEQWQTNVDEMFGESNMNKLEAAFGKPYRKALEDILGRMKSGRNKKFTAGNEQVDRWNNWVNNSVGTIMFLNSRSAILQTLSTVNFINFNDNNVFKAGAAFANQPQYWKDFMFLFNSDFLKERRGGLRFNVSESEIADAAKKGGAAGVVSKILQAGFLPTQMADSFAIASGGATFYRNRVNSLIKKEYNNRVNEYLKQSIPAKEIKKKVDSELNEIEKLAKEKAFLDFREIAEETQQSSRPDRISMEQAGPLGRTILAFANTPAQYTRILKKAALDIKYGRGDFKTNMSRLIYYGVVQNIIFGAIQAATFSLMFGDGDEEDQLFEEKAMRIANGTADSILRGAGLYGAIAATIKNTVIKLIKESKKPRTDYFEAGLVELAGISPPIQSKVKKWRNATKSYEYNKKEMAQKGFSIENPAYLAGANVIAAFTNVPTDRVVKKVTNVYDAVQEDVDTWKRTALLMGWSKWELEPTVKKAKTKKKKAIKKTNPRIRSRSSNSRARPSRAR